MDVEKIKAFFTRDRYLTTTGVRIDEVGEDFAVCSFDIADMHLNGADVVQGGATYTLADSAFAVASNAGLIERGEPKITVNQSASISYFRPPKGGKLIARAEKISGGRRMSVYRVEVSDELGTDVALMVGNGYTIDR
ncbi:MAG: PaaI family thioesterase [Clostridiales Family XIII bacterium]|jgi:acyl-CoA thioesterase|nr:PaaI family thioesterase [Clostridiales Family XIII bacterium]